MKERLVIGVVAGGFALSAVLPPAAEGQVYGQPESIEWTYGISADVASRYVWRGLDLSDAVNVQPAAWIASGPLEIGTWGSHALEGDYHEQDFWITYYLPPSNLGSFALSLTDYYVESDFGDGFFDFEGTRVCRPGEVPLGRPGRCPGGPHTAEVSGLFALSALPIEALLAYNFHNDPEKALYGEVAYRPAVAGFVFGFVAGGVFDESRYYYGTEGAAVTNLSAGVSSRVPGLPIDIPFTVEVVHNPEVGDTYYVARAGVAIGG